MSADSLIPPQPASAPKRPTKDRLEAQPGKLTHLIGTGENAQFSIVYKTISWSFLAATIFSLLVIGHAIFNNGTGILDSIKGVWAIFIPVITLALGYIFGKSK